MLCTRISTVLNPSLHVTEQEGQKQWKRKKTYLSQMGKRMDAFFFPCIQQILGLHSCRFGNTVAPQTDREVLESYFLASESLCLNTSRFSGWFLNTLFLSHTPAFLFQEPRSVSIWVVGDKETEEIKWSVNKTGFMSVQGNKPFNLRQDFQMTNFLIL